MHESSDEDDELVAVTPNQRNWRGILIALLVIVAVLALIVFSIVLLSPPDEGPRVRGEKLSLEEALGPRLRAARFNGSWASETELAFLDAWGAVVLLNAENLTTRELVRNTTMRQYNAERFQVSGDLRFVLLESRERRKIFKYSYETRYYICEVISQQTLPLAPPGAPGGEEAPPLQLARWAPVGSALAFVSANNIFYRPQANGATYQVTHSGRPGVVFNGVPDWLYEEEILHSRDALWFSPDGRVLLFATFNDSRVDELRFPWYGAGGGGGGGGGGSPYPAVRTLRYPRAGRPNPVATLWAVDVGTPQALHHIDVKPPPEVLSAHDNGEHYVLGVRWAPTGSQRTAAVVWSNRRQNVTVVSLCHAASGLCDAVHAERGQAEGGGWAFAPPAPPIVARDAAALVAVLPVRDGERGAYAHACHVAVDTGRVTPLTHGPFEVTRLLHWDEDAHLLYFQATPEWQPGQRHIYRVDDGQGNGSRRGWDCLTCPPPDAPRPRVPFRPVRNVTREAPASTAAALPPCLFAEAAWAPGGGAFAVVECLGPDVPVDALADVARNLSLVAVLDWRHTLRERWANISQPQVRTFQAEVEGGFHAQVRLLLPQGLRDYEEMTFPLVLHVSAAPGSQLVSERWGVDWATSLASRRNFIVARVDGRGSGFQGEALRRALHRRLGAVEIEDQIAVITFLRDNIKYVDRERMAVWGRGGYGGFAAAMILAQDIDVFRCGAAVAPVASWAEYASAFSERYMGTPNVTDNYRGYDEADVAKRAGNLRRKSFLLAHGTADGTAHFRHSMALVRALAREGVLFRQQAYPDEDHDLSGVRLHLHQSLEGFLDDCFGPLDFAEWEVGSSFFNFKQ